MRNPLTVLLDKLSPRRRLLRRYVDTHGRLPRLDPPVSFNEHITYRLLYDRDPRLKIVCDKIAVKKLVRDRVGSQYVVPLLGAWRRPKEIEWDTLPESFALKPNQTSGPFALIEDRARLDIQALTAEMQRWSHEKPHAFLDREWGYKGLPRYIIAEPLLRSPGGGQAREICLYTFHGRAAILQLLSGRKFTPERCGAWLDVDGRQLALGARSANGSARQVRMTLDSGVRGEAVSVAETLSNGMSSLRVDFVVAAEGLQVLELTAYSFGGRALWNKPEMDEMTGRLFSSPDTSFIPDFE